MRVEIQWNVVVRRKSYVDVPDGTTSDALARDIDKFVREDLTEAAIVIDRITWQTSDGRFGALPSRTHRARNVHREL